MLIVCAVAAKGQDKKELEERKIRTQHEIEQTNTLLLETQKNRQNNIHRVRILSKRIQLRNEIVENINEEIRLIENEIEQKAQLISNLEKDLTEVKDQYAELVIHSYWNKSKRDWMMFILSADNFNQAYRRMKYLQNFSVYRRNQAELIVELKSNIVNEIERLEEIKVDKEGLVLAKKNETRKLLLEKNGKDQLVAELSKRERELKNEINEKRRIADKLEAEIAKIIAEEARKASNTAGMYSLTPEEKLISDNFQGNKGKLPWPVERGVITGRYGVHRHAVLKQLTVKNDGIDISTVKGAEARALFEGEVTKIIAILGANYTVIIRHGNFLSVYQNLIDLKVKQGDKVKVKQVLGTVYTDNETNSTVLHIEIWKERLIQNPEDWISRN
jgi:septal ring factor EnvC (AmiA/AmiB activator)